MNDDEPIFDKVVFGFYTVGIIDILNQRQQLEKWDRLQSPGSIDAEYLAAIQKTVGAVHVLRKFANEFIDSFNSPVDHPDEMTKRFPDIAEAFDVVSKERVKVHTFSDTTVYFAPIGDSDEIIQTKCVSGIFGGLAAFQLGALSAKMAPRGAIDIGMGCDMFEGEVYGPCLSKAYSLESKESDYPRIIISDEYIVFLQQLSQKHTNSSVDIVHIINAQQLLGSVFRDRDGFYCLDYAGERYSRFAKEAQPELIPMFPKALQFARDSLRQFKFDKNELLTRRYELLVDYLEAREKYWV